MSPRGGKRPGSGRKPDKGGPRLRTVGVRLSEEEAETIAAAFPRPKLAAAVRDAALAGVEARKGEGEGEEQL